MTGYAIAEEISRNGGHGDNYTEKVIKRNGGWGTGFYPPIFLDRKDAVEYIDKMKNKYGKCIVEFEIRGANE